MPDLAVPAPPFPLKPREEWTADERERFDAALAKMAAAFEQIKAVLTEFARQFTLAWPGIMRALRHLARIQRSTRVPYPHLAHPKPLGRRGRLYHRRRH